MICCTNSLDINTPAALIRQTIPQYQVFHIYIEMLEFEFNSVNSVAVDNLANYIKGEG